MVDETIELGDSGVQASRVGMSASGLVAPGCSERDATVAVRHALDGGVTLFDVADVDGLGQGEELLSRALGINRFHVTVATKFGVAWDQAGRTWREISPGRVRIALEASLRRLRLQCIPLYYVQGFEGNSLLTDVLGELERCRSEGKIRAIGLADFEDADLLSAGRRGGIDVLQIPPNLRDGIAFHGVAAVARKIGASTIGDWSLRSAGVSALFDANCSAEVDQCLADARLRQVPRLAA